MTLSNKHKWDFQNIGGTLRVNIHSGEDIRHLAELDQKMWTVLSCPVSGLEIDGKSLQYTDADADGKIHVKDVITTAGWLCNVLKDPETLLHKQDALPLSSINTGTEEGKHIFQSAKQIIENLGKEEENLTVQDTQDGLAIFAKTRFNGDGVITENSTDDSVLRNTIASILSVTGGTADRSGMQGINAEQINGFYADLQAYTRWKDSAVELPFGEQTDAVMAAYKALDAKVRDFFVRCKLAAFSTNSAAALDVQVSRIEAISREDLTLQTEEIASYPIARISPVAEIDLTLPVNPAWIQPFEVIRSVAFPAEAKVITEADWNAVGDKLAPYIAWLNAKQGSSVEPLGEDVIRKLLEADRQAALLQLVEQDEALKEEADNISQVDKLLHLYRDFATILRNFVTLQDFYSHDKATLAVFQAGTLVIDQRACHLCMRVADMAKHNTQVAASGMYLIYCDCTTKNHHETLHIVAAMTVGDTGDIMVGKNAIFYDRNGLDWDAVVTKIVENPISISQAFWSPYRRLGNWVENLIQKNAADKDSKIMADMTGKLSEKAVAPAEGTTTAAAQPFDIAKFAGIFAAFGMALGMIGSAIASLATGFSHLAWWKDILVIVAILLIISGPSMIMAWMKLRKRNIAPLLNANGWAVNASSTISIPFGATLTDTAKFPVLKLQDPYAKKGLPVWKRVCISLAASVVLIIGLWLGNLLAWAKLPSPLFHKNKATTEQVVTIDTPVSTDETIETPVEDAK